RIPDHDLRRGLFPGGGRLPTHAGERLVGSHARPLRGERPSGTHHGLRRTASIVLVVALAACASPEGTGDARIVAQVGESTLTWGQVREAVPYAQWQADSLAAARQQAENWVLRRLMSAEAD